MHSTETAGATPASKAALAVWDNEGGAPPKPGLFYRYGKRLEPDQTWTIYHVFTGRPAQIGVMKLAGLTRARAARKLHSLNLA